jgi:hypothetical protein
MPTSGNGYSHTVAQASGMVSVQASCDIAAAIVLMQSLAGETECTLDEIAGMVIEREIRFDP